MNERVGSEEEVQKTGSSGSRNNIPYRDKYKTNNFGVFNNIKTALCKNHEEGNCKYGANCKFAHGKEELRAPAVPGENQQHAP